MAERKATAKPSSNYGYEGDTYMGSGKPIHHGFLTTRFIITQQQPLLSSEHGKSVGQLIDAHIEEHNSKVREHREELMSRGENPANAEMGFISSITLDLPSEE